MPVSGALAQIFFSDAICEKWDWHQTHTCRILHSTKFITVVAISSRYNQKMKSKQLGISFNRFLDNLSVSIHEVL